MATKITNEQPRDHIQAPSPPPPPFAERQGVTARSRLEARGIALPATDTLDEDELTDALWRVIDASAAMQIFLLHTDHLSDRELYHALLTDILDEDVEDAGASWSRGQIIDVLGQCDEEDNQIYLRFYADESFRQLWSQDFPEEPVPLSERPPADRDRLLPSPWKEANDG